MTVISHSCISTLIKCTLNAGLWIKAWNCLYKSVWQKERLRMKEAGVSSSWSVRTASFGGSAEDVKVSSSSLLYERNISSASCSSSTASNQNMCIILSSVNLDEHSSSLVKPMQYPALKREIIFMWENYSHHMNPAVSV